MSINRFAPHRATAALLQNQDMRLLGIERTSRIARAWNRRRWGPSLEYRREELDHHLSELDGAGEPSIELRDGWALDESRSLPHLDRLLEEMGEVIEERGGRQPPDAGKAFLVSILGKRAWERYGSILDFASSPDVLAPIARYCGFVPHLSTNLPRGVRLMESSTKFDPQPEGPWRQSQLWHIDYHSSPTIYVIVALRDIDPEDGPLTFLGEAASRRAAAALGYGSRGAPYRVTDEAIERLVDPSEVRRFTAPAGSVLFIDSSRCFHYGSRMPAKPRYHMQYAYVSPVRNDFSDLLLPQADYGARPADPLSRRLALDRSLLGA